MSKTDWFNNRNPRMKQAARKPLTNDPANTELVIVTWSNGNDTATFQTIFDTREETVESALNRIAMRWKRTYNASMADFVHIASYRVNEGVKTHYSLAHHYHHKSVDAQSVRRHFDQAYWATEIK